MPRPCTCERPGCRLCHLYHTDKAYRLLWDEGITTVFCGWVCLGENVRDPANWKRVAVEASQETAQDVMDKEARRVGALRTLLTMGGNPAEPMIWITDPEPRSLESLVDRLDRLAREGNRENP